MTPIPFNKPFRTGEEADRVASAIAGGWTGGNGPATQRCEEFLGQMTGASRVLMTHSCTGALEMAALLSDVGPGDEVIVPSYTFVSTANAFVLRGAVPVFVDVVPDTLCIDPARVADAVTARTRALVCVHYGGVACDMAALTAIAREHSLLLIEDAAQAVGAAWDRQALGAIGDLGAFSFHETKNLQCGEGGALLVNDARFAEHAEVLQEKGTNRARFARDEVDRYTWVDIGSSFLMSDTSASMLIGQLERVEEITRARLEVWQAYDSGLAALEASGGLRRLRVPGSATHNAHLYAIVLASRDVRDHVIKVLAARGISAYFHYVPLHSSPAGMRYGRTAGAMTVTDEAGDGLLRLPLWVGMTAEEVERVLDGLGQALGS
jgi:dTDP-4-amino-4,6-dideoxygalactose transaminase